MARLKTEQAKSMWTRLVIRYVLALVIFTLVYAVMLVTCGNALARSIGNYVADSTSTWHYVTATEFNDLVVSDALDASNLQVIDLGPVEAYYAGLGANLPEGIDADAAANGTSSDGQSMDWDRWETLSEEEQTKILEKGFWGDTMIAYRDLSVYKGFKPFKPLAAIVLYLIGLLVITIWFMRRPMRAVDAISGAIASPGLVKGEAVTLPRGLKTTQSELELLQSRILRNEMEAKAAEERKNELVTYLAHDIRTPLTSVRGYLELISEGEGMSAERQRDFAGRALVKADRLESLVEELFEITRYNMQNIPIERERLDMSLLCEQVAEEFYPQAQARDLAIEVDVQAGLDAFLDSSRMGRVLENVVKNAIAHASAGTSVVIGVVADDEADAVVLSVSNVGKEISPEHLEHVFDRFYRGDAARGQSTGGAGLGLAIAKEIVEAHGGIISATSEGGLTTFSIRLPK